MAARGFALRSSSLKWVRVMMETSVPTIIAAGHENPKSGK
jgi:hypothetical protein